MVSIIYQINNAKKKIKKCLARLFEKSLKKFLKLGPIPDPVGPRLLESRSKIKVPQAGFDPGACRIHDRFGKSIRKRPVGPNSLSHQLIDF